MTPTKEQGEDLVNKILGAPALYFACPLCKALMAANEFSFLGSQYSKEEGAELMKKLESAKARFGEVEFLAGLLPWKMECDICGQQKVRCFVFLKK